MSARASTKRSTILGRRERAASNSTTSVSLVDWQIAPPRMSSRRSVSPLVRLPLWATARPPASSSANRADGPSPRQAIDGRSIREVIADQPLAALRVEPDAVESDNAGGLLAAML